MLARRRDLASVTAVLGLILFGVYVVYSALKWANTPPGKFSAFYGPVLLDGETGAFTVVEGIAFFAAGLALTPRLLASFGTDVELVRQAQALTQRVTRLTQTRSDATRPPWPNCAASSATCTTAPRPALSRWVCRCAPLSK
jgi:hypothetical protein